MTRSTESRPARPTSESAPDAMPDAMPDTVPGDAPEPASAPEPVAAAPDPAPESAPTAVAGASARPRPKPAPFALPEGFAAALMAPLLADPASARLAVSLLGAPLVDACARACPEVALDLDALRPAAQLVAIRAKPLRARLMALCTSLARVGAPPVAIKGLATSLTLYDRPYLRLLPDADLLFREEDLPAATWALGAWRFESRPEACGMRRWGALTEASFAPVAPPDGAFLVDVHRHVDDPPASRGLTTEALFARSERIETDAGVVFVPAPEHAFCILALHAFRDRYEPRGLKSLVDAALLIEIEGARIDWDEVERCALAGRFVSRILFYCELLAALGVALPHRPFADRRLSAAARRLLPGVVANFRAPRRLAQPDWRKLAFEAVLLDGPAESLRLNIRRLGGLFAPRNHLLPGIPSG